MKEAKSASDGLSAFTVRRVERLEARYGEEQVDMSFVLTLRPFSGRGSAKPELINGITILLRLAKVNKNLRVGFDLLGLCGARLLKYEANRHFVSGGEKSEINSGFRS